MIVWVSLVILGLIVLLCCCVGEFVEFNFFGVWVTGWVFDFDVCWFSFRFVCSGLACFRVFEFVVWFYGVWVFWV